MRLRDKVALITGAGNGIGRESARLFAAEGASVLIVDLLDAAGTSVAEEIRREGGRPDFFGRMFPAWRIARP